MAKKNVKKTSRPEGILGEHAFAFGDDCGGEALTLTTKVFANGDDPPHNIYLNQLLTLQSNCNSAIFELVGTPITPKDLRRLADEMETAIEAMAGHKLME